MEGGVSRPSFVYRGKDMNPQQKAALHNMRLENVPQSEIAARLGISVNTVRSYIRRHPLRHLVQVCPNCGKPVYSKERQKKKKFCNDACRTAWWNSHLDQVKRRAYYPLVCQNCGKEFLSYGNPKRKFCCRECYSNSRRSIQSGESAPLSHLYGVG